LEQRSLAERAATNQTDEDSNLCSVGSAQPPELARQIGQEHSNVRYWETSGNLPRSDVLLPLARTLGVTVEELLGEPHPKRVLSPGGKMRRLFEAASKLPRSQQEKVLAVLEPFVAQHANNGNGRS
jgi:transcriptional regulator with XRE-family HTH domain